MTLERHYPAATVDTRNQREARAALAEQDGFWLLPLEVGAGREWWSRGGSNP
ncbi:hypothetical protein SPHINGO8AM_140018 [Sphingomonas sp. 8AM]|nr:hypothetical protein SPHINGO8AM_140018 [Sphingomonas sp. 8AM]